MRVQFNTAHYHTTTLPHYHATTHCHSPPLPTTRRHPIHTTPLLPPPLPPSPPHTNPTTTPSENGYYIDTSGDCVAFCAAGTYAAEDGSCVAFCDAGFYLDDSSTCVACPPGSSCTTVPEKSVVLTTATTLGLEGGVDALDTDAEKATFESGIVEAMAAGENGLGGTIVVVTRVRATTSRRLSERAAEDSSGASYNGMVSLELHQGVKEQLEQEKEQLEQVKSCITKTVDSSDIAIAEVCLKEIVDYQLSASSSQTQSVPTAEPNHRSLSVSLVEIAYTLTVPIKGNEAIGNEVAIQVIQRPFYSYGSMAALCSRRYNIRTVPALTWVGRPSVYFILS